MDNTNIGYIMAHTKQQQFLPTQTTMSKELNKAFSSGVNVDTTDDASFLENEAYNWDDLNKLKDELANSILNFMQQVTAILQNQEVVNNLGDKKEYFSKVVNAFFSDVNSFSHKVAKLIEEHKDLTGKITNLDEFNKYNRLAIEYNCLFNDLITLVSPSLTELVIIVSDVASDVNTKVNADEVSVTGDTDNSETKGAGNE